MAYSPTPQVPVLQNLPTGTFNSRYRPSQASLSPPPPPQPSMNKRDKKRQAMADRLSEISKNFSDNRDVYYRERLRRFQADITFINNAQLYDNRPLDDLIGSREGDGPGSSQTNGRTHPSAHTRMHPPQSLGKHAAMFVQDINDTLEEKDADLTRLANNHNSTIDQLRKDYDFNISVAEEENKRLMDTLRQRLITNVQTKKTALQRDKEKLDIADTSALLYHPNQFSMNNAASPGGPHGNRKTRHTRHRLEAEDPETATAANGKRKRKGLADGDNGSPIRDPEPLASYKFNDPVQEDSGTASYTIDKLFSEKDLNSHLQWASLKVISDFQASKRRKLEDSTGNLPADVSEPEDNVDGDLQDDADAADAYLEAPGMERSATNQSYHATRSTRVLNIVNGASREKLGELAGRQVAAELIGTFHREKKKEDDYNRAAPLSGEGVEHDLALIAKAMKAEDQGHFSDTNVLDDLIGTTPDYVRMPQVNGERLSAIR